MTYNNMICHFAEFKEEKRQTDLGQSDLQASNFCGTYGIFWLDVTHRSNQGGNKQADLQRGDVFLETTLNTSMFRLF